MHTLKLQIWLSVYTNEETRCVKLKCISFWPGPISSAWYRSDWGRVFVSVCVCVWVRWIERPHNYDTAFAALSSLSGLHAPVHSGHTHKQQQLGHKKHETGPALDRPSDLARISDTQRVVLWARLNPQFNAVPSCIRA